MKKWFFLLGALVLVYLLSRINSPRARAGSPLLQRINWTINVLVWVLSIAYGLGFLYWLYKTIFH